MLVHKLRFMTNSWSKTGFSITTDLLLCHIPTLCNLLVTWLSQVYAVLLSDYLIHV